MKTKAFKELLEYDSLNLLEWGRKRDEIIKFIETYLMKSLGTQLFELIGEYEELGRQRVRISTSLGLLDDI